MARDFYEALCAEQEMKMNPNIVEVLEKTTLTEYAENSALRSLDLMFNDILTDGAEILSRSLQIGNRGAMALASMLQVNNTLQELELADCDLEEWAVHCSEMLS
ncbi:hypothetical protein INR49_012190 [Caranx melampygus]|nr:hypothetical protein INR49_012190 [Caranx melampygus]